MAAARPKEQEPEQPESDEEIARRRDEALRRALNTPPKPHRQKERPAKQQRRKFIWRNPS